MPVPRASNATALQTELDALWAAAQERLAQTGSRLTLARLSRATGTPVATLSDWRRGNHLPREASELFTVVAQLARWAQAAAPSRTHWRNLLEAATDRPQPDDNPPPPNRHSAIASLGDLLTAAFAEDDVRIDAVCLSGQALSIAIGRAITAVHTAETSPRRITVRVLLPSRDINLAFPIAVSYTGNGDDNLHQRWLARRNAHGQTLRAALLSLRDTHGIDVHVLFRALPFTPMAKLFLVNNTEALFSYYTLERRTEIMGTEHLDIFDANTMGLVRLFGTDSDSDDAAFVEQSRMWFNSLWDSVTTDLSLS